MAKTQSFFAGSVAGTVTGLVQSCLFAPRMLGPPLPAHSGGQLPATQLENSSSVLFSLTPRAVPPPPSWLLELWAPPQIAALARFGPTMPGHHASQRSQHSYWDMLLIIVIIIHLQCVVGCLRSNVLVIIIIRIMSVSHINVFCQNLK